MDDMNYDLMGKEALRAEMRARELSYSKMNNDQMRAALRANDAELSAFAADHDDFAMSQAELDKQTVRQDVQSKRVSLSDEDKQQVADEAASRTPAPVPTTPKRATRAGLKIESNREERNGVKRPSLGGVCRQVWDFCDAHRDVIDAKLVRTEAAHSGWNVNNSMIEFYQWRKFNGISGRSK